MDCEEAMDFRDGLEDCLCKLGGGRPPCESNMGEEKEVEKVIC